MIKQQRKKHALVWMALAVLIPVAIISAYMVVPKQVSQQVLQNNTDIALPVIVKKIERKDYTAFLRCNSGKSNYQLQLTLANESTYPSALIYQLKNTEKELIGRVATKATYYFPLKADSSNSCHFIVYDIIHGQNIDSINF